MDAHSEAAPGTASASIFWFAPSPVQGAGSAKDILAAPEIQVRATSTSDALDAMDAPGATPHSGMRLRDFSAPDERSVQGGATGEPGCGTHPPWRIVRGREQLGPAMNSLRSHLFLLLLKYRHVFRGKLRRPVVDRTTSIAALRARADKSSARFGSLPRGIEVAPVSIDGIAAEWVRPPVDGARVILYFHGGGYVMGSRVSHRPAVANFVAGSGLAALVFDYRLAPEHPFPAALEDALAAYSWLLARETSDDIVLLGDSAGGGLALATLLALRDRGMPLPAAAAVMSPWTDLTCTGETYQRPDPLAPAGSWHVFAHHYCAGQDPRNPMISPLYGDQRGLPPLLIHVGERESMLSDSTRLAEKAREAGVRVRLHVGRGMVHCYPVFSPKFPEARKAMDDICEFLRTGR